MAHIQSYRILLDDEIQKKRLIKLEAEQSYYLNRVLRAKKSDVIRVFNGKQGEWHARIISCSKHTVEIMIEDQQKPQSPAPLKPVTLCFSPIKGRRQNNIVEKSVEMGVSFLQPLRYEFTTASSIKQQRTQKQIRESIEQSESLLLTKLLPIVSFTECVEAISKSHYLLFCDEKHCENVGMRAMQDSWAKSNRPVAVFIGPEGGFAKQEKDMLYGCDNMSVVALGTRVLRADTACIAALVIVQKQLEKKWGVYGTY